MKITAENKESGIMRLIFIPIAVVLAFASLGFEMIGCYKCAYWLNEVGIFLEKL